MGFELNTGFSVFQNQLRQMRRRCLNFQPAFAIIDRSFSRYEKKKWATEGPGWTELAPDTILKKASNGAWSDKMMVRGEVRGDLGTTQDLRGSLTSHTAYSLYQVTPLSLTEGTRVSYAQYHQKGDGVPQRPVMDILGEVRGTGGGTQLLISWYEIMQTYFLHGAATASVVGAAASQA